MAGRFGQAHVEAWSWEATVKRHQHLCRDPNPAKLEAGMKAAAQLLEEPRNGARGCGMGCTWEVPVRWQDKPFAGSVVRP